jgi:hypothetical protein
VTLTSWLKNLQGAAALPVTVVVEIRSPQGSVVHSQAWTRVLSGAQELALSDAWQSGASAEAGTYAVLQQVWDAYGEHDLNGASFTVTAQPGNRAPVADAGPDRSVQAGSLVYLDGSASFDPDGHLPLAYRWSQTGGVPVTLMGAGLVSATFTAPNAAAVLTFSLAVTDAVGLAGLAPDEVVISVTRPGYDIYLPVVIRS